MAMRLRKENVQYIIAEIMKDVDYWTCEGKEAEKALCYIAGVKDMAEAVIKAIEELGGQKS